MRFIATDEQVKQMGCNAINASTPMGMGVLHYDESVVYTADMFQSGPITTLMHIDYIGGRMVKLSISRDMTLGDHWEVGAGREPTSDYQSWCSKYPTYEDLAKSVGAEIIKEKED